MSEEYDVKNGAMTHSRKQMMSAICSDTLILSLFPTRSESV